MTASSFEGQHLTQNTEYPLHLTRADTLVARWLPLFRFVIKRGLQRLRVHVADNALRASGRWLHFSP